MTYCVLFLAFIVAGASDSLENSLIGQFAVTSNDSIVYLDNLGRWHAIDSFVGESHFFVITSPLIRYDTIQYGQYPIGRIISDTARIIPEHLQVNSAFQLQKRKIELIKDVSLENATINIPKCPEMNLRMHLQTYTSMLLLIDTVGNISEILILESGGNMLWDKLVDNAAKDGQFVPIIINGRPVEFWLIMPIGNHIERVPE